MAAYLEHRHLCAAEVPVERFFMDVAIARLVCVHALVIRPRLAVGRLAPAGRLIGDPRWRGPSCMSPYFTATSDASLKSSSVNEASRYAGDLSSASTFWAGCPAVRSALDAGPEAGASHVPPARRPPRLSGVRVRFYDQPCG